ncbi:MAG: GNAT family N-acetyltransferase, partial [Candidatus Promineifilaceae bacterium]|nr:GNAT family N-acetyltransferase [Candidatus Promineifilaceae bacterium]
FIERDDAFDPTLWHLAIDDDQIAGVSLCRPSSHQDPAMGWISTLGVRRPWRRQGLGLALLRQSFLEFHKRATVKVGLDVDSQSLTGATRLYRKAGMRELRRYDLYAKELRPGKIISKTQIG